MKHILKSEFLIILLFPAFTFGVTMDDLVETDGLHYKKFADVTFTEKITGKTRGSFEDSKKVK